MSDLKEANEQQPSAQELGDEELGKVAGGLTTSVTNLSATAKTTTTSTKGDGTFTRTDATTGLAADANFGSA